MNDYENTVRQRAHAIWEREGRPHGRDREHWAQAEAEIQAEQSGERKQKANRPAPTATPARKATASKKAATKPAPKAGTEKAGGKHEATKTTTKTAAIRPKRAPKTG